MLIKELYKNELFKDKITTLHWGQFFLLCLGTFLIRSSIFEFLIFSSLLFFIFLMSYKMILNLYYSYWTFAVINIFFQINYLFKDSQIDNGGNVGYLFSITIIMQLVLCYFLSSPLYYPILKWWKYDISLKKDLAVMFKIGEKEYEARIIDIRMKKAAILMFEKLDNGTTGEILIKNNPDINFNVTIKNIRNADIGRGSIYGINFQNSNSPEVLRKYKELKNLNDEYDGVKA